MWKERKDNLGGTAKFFRIGLSHDSLVNIYYTNFAFMQHHKYSLTELENMIPWERDIYTGLLMNYLKEEKEKLDREKHRRR